MKKDTLKIDTIHQCNCCLGNKTLHPMVSVIDLSKANLTDYSIKFSFYTLLLIENECNEYICGRKYYDYSNATLIFLSPGESIQMDGKKSLPCKGRLLAFHPYLICDTTLDMHINSYTFFSYQPDESLHLSLREKTKVIECLGNIEQELGHAVDKHSRTIISRYIELLLDYCSRFYERQFITRNEANKEILNRMETLLDEYIQSGKLKTKTMPSAEYCATRLSLSTPYFIDLLKFETGKTLTDYFQLKRIEVAKQMLLDKNCTAIVVSDLLGFPNVQHFNKVFQKLTGIIPEEYRCAQN